MNRKDKIKQIKKLCQYKFLTQSRLMIQVKGEGFFYDIGIRAIEDPYNCLSKTVNMTKGRWTEFAGKGGQCTMYGMNDHPRFLEDFVEKYGKKNVRVYTSLTYNETDVSNELFKMIEELKEMQR